MCVLAGYVGKRGSLINDISHTTGAVSTSTDAIWSGLRINILQKIGGNRIGGTAVENISTWTILLKYGNPFLKR